MKRHGLRKQDTGYRIVLEIFKDYLLRMEMVAEHFCVCLYKKNAVIFFMFIEMTFCVIVQCFEAQLF